MKSLLFLRPLYYYIALHFQGKINHFPLIQLIIYSLDKTIFYLLLFLGLRYLLKIIFHKRIYFKRELKIIIFTGYILMLLALTVFRGIYFPWQIQLHLNRPLTQINWIPLVQTLKLTQGKSPLDFFYNSLGNIFWFIPFGFGRVSLARHKISFWHVVLAGIALSVSIEFLQFVLYTGVSDIDDVIFNTIGAVIGYKLYRILFH